ncbi:MAG: hypothetical protein LBS53_04310 [Synergistaceae bacterium]|nr:hypothetical protein [Synergistaceae bacterium]
MKCFEDGGWVNLSELGIVEIGNDEALITAALIIVDGEPGDEEDVKYPAGGSGKCGVKLVESEGEKFLFIYDGKKDGIASDPITLVNFDDGPGSGSGGGCDAGLSFGAFVLLAGMFLVSRRGKRQ